MKVRLQEDPREWRKSVLLMVIPLAVLSSLLRWRRILPTPAWLGLLGVVALLAVAAWVQPHWFRGYYRVSTRAGFWLSQVIARVVLAGIFFLLVTPLGLLFRLLGKDPLRLKRSPAAASYWQSAKESGPLDRLF